MKRLILVAMIVAGACGDSKNDADPRVIPGGGVGDGSINGKLNVYVIKAYSDVPVANAEVTVGEPGETPLTGTTDSSGLYTFEADIDGPQTITVVATGYVVTTWFGADGANVTIPLTPTGDSGIAKARLEGAIAGWDTLPDTTSNDHMFLASVQCSESDRLGDPANELEQPTIGGLPGNVCIKAAQGSRCSWALNCRVGTVDLYAAILEVDTKGTVEDSDDTFEVHNYAFHLDTTVEGGVDQTGIILEQAAVGSLTDVAVTVAAPLSGLTESLLILGIDRPDRGRMMLGLAKDPSGTVEVTVPELAGDFAAASYFSVAFASANLDQDGGDATGIIRNGITSSAVDLGAWLGLATDLSLTAGTYSFVGDGSPFYSVDFRDAANHNVWELILLDGRTTFTLPGISASPLPSDAVDMVVGQFTASSIDTGDFAIDDFWSQVERTSTARKSFTF